MRSGVPGDRSGVEAEIAAMDELAERIRQPFYRWHIACLHGMRAIIQGRPAEAERIFHALADNGTVRMPIQQTFWATRFGMVVDKFGTPWMINCEAAA